MADPVYLFNQRRKLSPQPKISQTSSSVLTINLYFNDSGIQAQFIFGNQSVRSAVRLGDIANDQNGMPLFRRDFEMTSRFDFLALLRPLDLGSRIAGEWNFDGNVFTLLKTGRVTETRRNVDSRSGCENTSPKVK